MIGVNRFISIVFSALLLQFCSQQEIAPVSQTVQFQFALDANQTTELPASSSVMLSITTQSGLPVLTNYEVDITAVDNGFITEPVSLGTSQYLVAEFMVMHDGSALYVTPKAASEFSKNVTTPLSYALSLPGEQVVRLEVVETKNEKAERFGYASLARKKSSLWKIMAFTREDGAIQMSRAWASLRAPGISYGSEIQAQINTLPFQGDPSQPYTLVVEKAGYQTYIGDFLYNDIPGNGNKPFRVVLDRMPNENTFTIRPPMSPGGSFTFDLGLHGSGTLVIDWADGTVETINFSPEPGSDASFVTASHVYGGGSVPPLGERIIMRGDLDNIFLFENKSVYADDIDLRNLSGLKDLTLYGLPINGLLDLSENSLLESVVLEGTYAWEIRLPESHQINEVLIGDPGGTWSASVVDTFIDNIHKNAIAKNITSGTVTIQHLDALSTESSKKLQELVEDYDWEVRLE